MTECKRNGCDQEAEIRPRYEGFCSLQCRDYHEYETEINAYKTAWRELREWLVTRVNELTSEYPADPRDLDEAETIMEVADKLQELEKSHDFD